MIVMMVPYSKWICFARVNFSLILEVTSVCENLTSCPLCVCVCVCVCECVCVCVCVCVYIALVNAVTFTT